MGNDGRIRTEGKQNLIIENKLYERNVNVDEIKKFLRDINEQKTNGIMMSQFSGIVSKSNFFNSQKTTNLPGSYLKKYTRTIQSKIRFRKEIYFSSILSIIVLALSS